MATMSPLRCRMIEDMTIRNLSPATQQSYLGAVTKFSPGVCGGRSPDRLWHRGVRTYQLHLTSQGIAWASLNQTVCALRFFFGVTLGRGEMPEMVVAAATGDPARLLARRAAVPMAVSQPRCAPPDQPQNARHGVYLACEAPATQQSYLGAVAKFSPRVCGSRSPDRLWYRGGP